MGYPVGKVAALSGVTVRTLHHYDEIGLLSPSGRTAAGYRSYSDDDLDRLQRVLFYRELGFGLETIAKVIEDPGVDALEHLRRQRALLADRIGELTRMAESVERVIAAKEAGNALTPEERFEVFGEFREPEGYAEEAVRRWGDTPQWRAAARPRSKEEWLEAEKSREDWVRRLLAVFDSGAPADSSSAMDLAEEHRRMLAAFMGDCDLTTHRELARLYATEPVQLGFLVREPDQRPGLGEYIRDAVHANADRAAG
ncbi:transcriptional regulator [Amycolatopsis sp. MJM2582]|uniref:MerR family transcriptional regulator n=1 Tax=Amycolatopsis TaxID=1813 RepID=UPI00050533A3|nr:MULTISPECIES: MerR family transcriptional regulator [unclassified Amycolatopsis]KFZ81283.1 transcriptional regulator [Amycolatopsis sp. MJM2582]RSN46242.1 MerR family transcriptional regulator [Amycolatopsis sp. WAC 04197]